MPLLNEQYWVNRFGQSDPCWSGLKWLDWEHGIVARSVFRRNFLRAIGHPPIDPKRAYRVLDVGCGDGRFGAWLREEFGCQVLGVDGLEFPGVRDHVSFALCDAELLHENVSVWAFRPDVVLFMNSLTCVKHWTQAVYSASRVAPRLVAFDNFMTPTPPWWKGLPHRSAIEAPALIATASSAGMSLAAWKTGDVMHRRLFLRTPERLHPAVAVVSAAIDLVAQRVVVPERARHSYLEIERRG